MQIINPLIGNRKELWENFKLEAHLSDDVTEYLRKNLKKSAFISLSLNETRHITAWDYYEFLLDMTDGVPLNGAGEMRETAQSILYSIIVKFDPLRDYIRSNKPRGQLRNGTIDNAIQALVWLVLDIYFEKKPYTTYKTIYTEEERRAGTFQIANNYIKKVVARVKDAGVPDEGFVQNRVMLQNALMQGIEKEYSLTGPRSIGAQNAQYTAGNSPIARNRINYMNPNYEFEKLRDIAEDDIVRLLAHRAPGEEYKSIHPPLEEMEEPDCVVRQMVEPTEGAKAGDKIISVSFTDSLLFAPITPYQRALSAYCRYKGVDCGVSSGRTIIEARERDIEKITKEQVDSELYDTARTGLRGRAMYGHSVRLDANGMMFDALRRWARDERTGEVSYVKDMIGGAMDKEVTLGKPMSEDDLRKRTTMYRNAQGGVWQEVDDPESMDVCAEIHWKRTVGGFQPWKNISDIKGGKKDVGVKNLKLFVPRGGVE